MKSFKAIIIIQLVFLFNVFCVYSQHEECGSAILHQYKMETDQLYHRDFEAAEQKIREMRSNNSGIRSTNYTIPVVVHVIHNGVNTPSYIPDDQINDAIVGLNERFSGSLGDGVDIEMEFCLAKRDPDGYSSTGINRVDGSIIPHYTEYGIEWSGNFGASSTDVKDLSKWPTTEYYNIWIVHKIAGGPGGIANLPTSTVNPYEGTVIKYDNMTYDSYVLTHELGHGFGLRHTFNGPGNSNEATCEDLIELDCEEEGDLVCDTSPHRQSDDCNSDVNPCIDNDENWLNSVKNFMSYCNGNHSRFSAGQKDRIDLIMETLEPRMALLESDGCLPLSALDAGISGHQPTCSQGLNVILKNYGLDDLTEVTIQYNLDGITGSFLWTGNLATQEEEEVYINLPISSNLGVNFSVWTTNPNGEVDQNPGNDEYFIENLILGLEEGTYTIGSDPTNDFPDLSTPINIMNAGGICGTVVFNVKEGTYTEILEIEDILGANAEHTITFQSDGSNLNPAIIDFNTSNGTSPILKLIGTDFISFKNLTFDKTNSYDNTVEIDGKVENILFDKCTFLGNTYGNLITVLETSDPNSKNLTFTNNTFENGSRAIYFRSEGASHTIISNNICNNQTWQTFYLYKQNHFIIENNIITGSSISIYMNLCLGNSTIRKNKIIGNTTGGIYLIFNMFTFSDDFVIANNFIDSYGYGIRMFGGSHTHIYYNTITVSNPLEAAFKETSISDGVNVRNNILANSDGGYALRAENQLTSNYNNLYSSGNNLVNFDDVEYNNLSAWQITGSDINSISVLPIFISSTDLHLIEDENDLLDGGALPYSLVLDDIDGEPRDNTQPDIGADEINTSSCGIDFPISIIEECNDDGTVSLTAVDANGQFIQPTNGYVDGVDIDIYWNVGNGTTADQNPYITTSSTYSYNLAIFTLDPNIDLCQTYWQSNQVAECQLCVVEVDQKCINFNEVELTLVDASGNMIEPNGNNQIIWSLSSSFVINENPIIVNGESEFTVSFTVFDDDESIICSSDILKEPVKSCCPELDLTYTQENLGELKILFSPEYNNIPPGWSLYSARWYVNGVVVEGSNVEIPELIYEFPQENEYVVCLYVILINSSGKICKYRYCDRFKVEKKYNIKDKPDRKRVAQSFDIYPNPTIYEFNIGIPEYLISNEDLQENIVLEIFDIFGKKVLETNIPTNTRHYQMNLQNKGLFAGTYLIVLKNKTKRFVRRLIVVGE